MLEKQTIVDLIETLENGCVRVRTCTRIIDDGAQISGTFHRHVVCARRRLQRRRCQGSSHLRCGAYARSCYCLQRGSKCYSNCLNFEQIKCMLELQYLLL